MIFHNIKNFKKNYKIKKKSVYIKKELFNDSEINVLNENIKNKDIIIYKINKDFNKSYIELLMFLYKYKKKKIRFNLILPYFPYSRQNKKTTTNLEFCCCLIKLMKPLKIITFDIHNFKSIKFLKNFYNINTYIFIKKIIRNDKYTLIFPDNGSKNRYKKLIKKNNSCIAFKKYRIKNKIKLKINKNKKLEFKKKILIIDDILDTGNTIKKILNFINKYKFKKIYLYVTHVTMNRKNFVKFCKNFVKVYTTNSFDLKANKSVKIFNIIESINYDKNFFEKK
ncbi:ribose-phosphate pyrophosphokinase-like domain-containing protein [Candidatus Vidania fulgoroideorum]